MAFDTAFNITWNQRVNKEESSFLKFLDKREKEQDALNPPPRKSKRERQRQRAMSDVDLMSAVRSERDSNVSGPRGGRSQGSRSASSSVLQKAGSSLSSPSRSRGKKAPPMTFEQMQEHVFNQYMNKYIKDLEVDAKHASVEEQAQKQKIKDGHQHMVDEKAKARQLATENGKGVQMQIEQNKQRRADTRKQFVEAASAHNFPLFTETFISQDEVEQYRKDVKVEFRKELDQQNVLTQTLKNMLVKKDKIYANEKSTTNIKNMQESHKFEHHEKRRKGDEMMRVWDRDIRLKSIKNAILSGKGDQATREMGVS